MVSIYDLDFIRKVNNAHGTRTKKEVTLYEIKRDIAQIYDELVDFQPNTLVDGMEMPLLVMDYQGSRIDRNRIKMIEAPPGSIFHLGSIVECLGQKWLVTDINLNDEIKLSGQMQLCNYILCFQDKQGNVYTEPCIEKVLQTGYNGLYENEVITTNDTIKHVWIQFSPQALHLHQEQRLFIDLWGAPNPKVYRITGVNRTSYIINEHGYFDLTCEEDELRDGDRPDLMLAGYIEPKPHSPTEQCKIVYTGEPMLKITGSSKRFAIQLLNNWGEILPNLNPTWEIVPLNFETEDCILIESATENEIRLRATQDAIAGGAFELKATGEDPIYGHYETALEIKVGELW